MVISLRFSLACVMCGTHFVKKLEFQSNLKNSSEEWSFSSIFISSTKTIPEKFQKIQDIRERMATTCFQRRSFSLKNKNEMENKIVRGK